MLPHLSNHVTHKQKLKRKHTELHLHPSLCFVGRCRETGMLFAISAGRVAIPSPRNSNVVGEMLKDLRLHYPKTTLGGHSGPRPQYTDLFLKYSVSMRRGARGPSVQQMLNAIPRGTPPHSLHALDLLGHLGQARTTPKVITLLLSPPLLRK